MYKQTNNCVDRSDENPIQSFCSAQILANQASIEHSELILKNKSKMKLVLQT